MASTERLSILVIDAGEGPHARAQLRLRGLDAVPEDRPLDRRSVVLIQPALRGRARRRAGVLQAVEDDRVPALKLPLILGEIVAVLFKQPPHRGHVLGVLLVPPALLPAVPVSRCRPPHERGRNIQTSNLPW